MRTDAGRRQVVGRGSRVTGVRHGDGDVLDADVVVLATGPAVPEALARLGIQIPDASINAVLVRTAPGGGLVIDAVGPVRCSRPSGPAGPRRADHPRE